MVRLPHARRANRGAAVEMTNEQYWDVTNTLASLMRESPSMARHTLDLSVYALVECGWRILPPKEEHIP